MTIESPPQLLQKLYDDLQDNLISGSIEPKKSSLYRHDLFDAICSGGWVSNRKEPSVSLDRTTIKYKKPGNQAVIATKPGWELKVECLIECDGNIGGDDMTTLQDWEFSLFSDGDYILESAGDEWFSECAYERRPICSVDEDYTKLLELLPDFWVYENY